MTTKLSRILVKEWFSLTQVHLYALEYPGSTATFGLPYCTVHPEQKLKISICKHDIPFRQSAVLPLVPPSSVRFPLITATCVFWQPVPQVTYDLGSYTKCSPSRSSLRVIAMKILIFRPRFYM